jgi:hypothetical protein
MQSILVPALATIPARPQGVGAIRRCRHTVHGWIRDVEMGFPQPMYFGRLPFWKERHLIAFERRLTCASQRPDRAMTNQVHTASLGAASCEALPRSLRFRAYYLLSNNRLPARREDAFLRHNQAEGLSP